MNKTLNISDKVILERFKSQERVDTIALSAGCSNTTIYRRMEELKESRPRLRRDERPPSNMSFRIKALPGYKNGKLIRG